MNLCMAHPKSKSNPDLGLDPALLRKALGRFVTGVTIVSTVTPEGAPVACTVNSFTSVSLEPPLVLFSLAKSKNSVVHFKPGRPFGVAVLSLQQRDLSDRFARSCLDKWDGIDYTEGRTGIPALQGAAVIFEGIVEINHDGGDHVIVIGRVHHLHGGEDDLPPLVFHRGRYAALS